MRAIQTFVLAISLAGTVGVQAQAPRPIVVQAANATTVIAAASAPAATESAAVQAAIKMLEQMKAANVETLKKQQETLQKLDDIRKAAEQLKIFSKRG